MQRMKERELQMQCHTKESCGREEKWKKNRCISKEMIINNGSKLGPTQCALWSGANCATKAANYRFSFISIIFRLLFGIVSCFLVFVRLWRVVLLERTRCERVRGGKSYTIENELWETFAIHSTINDTRNLASSSFLSLFTLCFGAGFFSCATIALDAIAQDSTQRMCSMCNCNFLLIVQRNSHTHTNRNE